eukprot:SAG31_NODE_677_length_12894_cov_4.083548_1_plen_180_part_00
MLRELTSEHRCFPWRKRMLSWLLADRRIVAQLTRDRPLEFSSCDGERPLLENLLQHKASHRRIRERLQCCCCSHCGSDPLSSGRHGSPSASGSWCGRQCSESGSPRISSPCPSSTTPHCVPAGLQPDPPALQREPRCGQARAFGPLWILTAMAPPTVRRPVAARRDALIRPLADLDLLN